MQDADIVRTLAASPSRDVAHGGKARLPPQRDDDVVVKADVHRGQRRVDLVRQRDVALRRVELAPQPP